MLNETSLDAPKPKRRADDDAYSQTSMRVTKRNGSAELVDLNKIVRAVGRCAAGLPDVDAMRVATRTISGLYDGATTRELDRLSIQTAAGLIAEEPQSSKLAARLLSTRRSSRKTCSEAAAAAYPCRTSAATSNSARTSASRRSACGACTAGRIRCPSWTCKTSRRSRTSSSGASRRIRWA